MQLRQSAPHRVIGPLEMAVLGACLIAAIGAGIVAARLVTADGAAPAFSVPQQAESAAVTSERAAQAWTERLNGLASAAVTSERAAQAWTARLNGLASEHSPGQ